MSDVDINASSTKEIMYAGGIVCEANGSVITRCTNSGDIIADDPGYYDETSSSYTYAGGIAAYVKNGSTVTDCNNEGNITAGTEKSLYAVAGGILGQIWVESPGTITLTGGTNSGVITALDLKATASGYDNDGKWRCAGSIVGEVYVYDGNAVKTNTLVIDDAVKNGTGYDQQDEAVADLKKSDGSVVGYASLEAALTAAADGDTVLLNQDVTIDGSNDMTKGQVLNIQKGITLDGNNHKIIAKNFNLNSGKPACDIIGVTGVRGEYPVTIKNINIVGDKTTTKNGINVYKSTKVTLENVNIQDCTALGLLVNASEVTAKGTLELSGNGWGDYINVAWGSSTTMDRCSFNASEASLVGITYICTYESDVNNAGGIDKFIITLPDGWTKVDSSDAALLYMPAAKSSFIVFKASEGIKYEDESKGGIRFIFDANIADTDSINTFGAYILPLSIFEDAGEGDKTAKAVNVQYNGKLTDGQSFSADIVDIPSSNFGTAIYALPYFVKDNTITTFNGTDTTVNESIIK